jgi:hypothetical protein
MLALRVAASFEFRGVPDPEDLLARKPIATRHKTSEPKPAAPAKQGRASSCDRLLTSLATSNGGCNGSGWHLMSCRPSSRMKLPSCSAALHRWTGHVRVSGKVSAGGVWTNTPIVQHNLAWKPAHVESMSCMVTMIQCHELPAQHE